MIDKDAVLAQDYAKALLRVIKDQSNLADIYQEIEAVANALETSGMDDFFKKDTYTSQDKATTSQSLKQFSDDTCNHFVQVLADRDSLSLLRESFLAVLEGIDKLINTYDLEVSSAYPLTKEQEMRLIAIVEKRFSHQVRKVIYQEDKSLVGGFVASINHQVIDASIKTQLANLY